MTYDEFKKTCNQQISLQGKDKELLASTQQWFSRANEYAYSYNFEWANRPLIQYPQDVIQFQECFFEAKPDIVIETGIAHGGSVALSASLLCLLDIMEGIDPRKSDRKVVAIDIDIRQHNRRALDDHPLRFKMNLLEGSSIDPIIVQEATSYIGKDQRVMVSLDSNHTHDHVLAELQSYAHLTSVGSYCIVFDTVIENLPPTSFPNRDWDIGNNPMTAVKQWILNNSNFQIQNSIDDKLLISVAPSGYLKRLF